MPGKTARAALQQARRLESLRVRGVRGGVIAPHRSMVGLPWTLWRLITTLVLALGGFALVIASLPWVGRFWQLVFERVRDFTGIDAPLGDQQFSLPFDIDFTLPFIAAFTPQPDLRTLWIAGGTAAAALALTFLLPERFTPLKYLLRLLALLQGTAIVYFAVSPEAFPYRLTDHVFVLETSGLVVMGLVPLVLGFTLHVFDLALWKKILLTIALLAHLAVFVPLQVLVHTWLVLHATAVIMPVLFLVFGLLLDVMVFVSFYGWALSWRGELERGTARAPARLGVKGSGA
ncbi:MAG TPA: hypothetical protein VFU23_12690 [Gemmatimonadales bacterium]|nr:hypothetical protein [Gemmatimonadales bacterium]